MTARAPILLLTALLTFSIGTLTTAHQAREHLTPEEIELIKDAQLLDKRIDVFIKAADRRMLVLSGSGSATTTGKQLKKDSETWGELPKGSRAELIGDIARIFDEAITNIDDVSSRDEKNPLIPKSLRKLAGAASRIVELLKPVEAQAKSDEELSSFDQLAEMPSRSCRQQTNCHRPPPPRRREKSSE